MNHSLHEIAPLPKQALMLYQGLSVSMMLPFIYCLRGCP